jgi:type IV secretion system protein VirB10
MWLMVAIAVVILVIILMTGQSQPTQRSQSGGRLAEPNLVSPERVRSYEQALAAEAARQQALAQQQPSSIPSRASIPASTTGPDPVDPLTDEQRRRDYQSLFADNVALSRRQTGRQPYGERGQTDRVSTASSATALPDLSLLQHFLKQNATPPVPGVAVVTESPESAVPGAADTTTAPVNRETSVAPNETLLTRPRMSMSRLLEGTLIETVLVNRLDGTFAGPVICLVTTPVYSHDRQSVVVPAGARVLGSSSPVQSWGDSRLAVSFHRLVMPNGRTHSLDRFKGLNQIGDTGLKDSVNRHYWQVFGASLAIGALSGLGQYGSRASFDTGFADSYRQSAGSSLAASTGRVLDRYLNVLPTITIREGYRIKVYLTNDLELPIYASVTPGGIR